VLVFTPLVMLVLALMTLLTAVALPSVHATPALLNRTATLVLIITAAMVTNAYSWSGVSTGISLHGGTLELTGASMLCQALVALLGAIALTITPKRLSWSTGVSNVSTYPLFALFTVLGGCTLASSGDMITVYVALELQSFSVYVMAALYRDSESATHSGLLYFMLGGLSSCIILLGFALVYSQTGITSLDGLYSILHAYEATPATDSYAWTVSLGMVAIGTGILFKVTAAPFHHWGPDVYDGVPTLVTTWLSIIPKVTLLGLFISLAHVFSNTFVMSGIDADVWSTLLLVSSVLSLIVGTVVGLAQTRIKRLLAYSTVSHMGFLLLALAVSTEESMASYAFYLIQYMTTSLLGFSTLLAMGYTQGRDITTINELVSVFKQSPALAVCLATTLFSMAGVPPLLGFYGKQAVLYSAINAGFVFTSIIAIVTSVISASYYLYVIRVAYFNDTVSSHQAVNPITAVHSYSLSVLALALLGFMAAPDLVLDQCRLVALQWYTV